MAASATLLGSSVMITHICRFNSCILSQTAHGDAYISSSEHWASIDTISRRRPVLSGSPPRFSLALLAYPLGGARSAHQQCLAFPSSGRSCGVVSVSMIACFAPSSFRRVRAARIPFRCVAEKDRSYVLPINRHEPPGHGGKNSPVMPRCCIRRWNRRDLVPLDRRGDPEAGYLLEVPYGRGQIPRPRPQR